MNTALLVQDLTVSLRGRSLVHGITFSIEAGERLALLGASGSGKSLTAAALLGHLPAPMTAAGLIQVDGSDIPLTGRRTGNRGLALIHQNPMAALNPLVRLGSQLAIPLQSGGLAPREAKDRASRLLESVGIKDTQRILASFSGELSGGQLQRVCIAFALACPGSILVADEPTTALDAVSQAKVLDVLAGPSTAGKAMLFITHDLAAAGALCTRALVLHSGRIVEEAPMDILLNRPQHPYTAQLVEAAQTGIDAISAEASA